MKSLLFFLLGFYPWFSAISQTVSPPEGDDVCLLSQLDLSTVTCFDDQGRNAVHADLATYGTPLSVGGVVYSSGVGTHAPSKFVIKVNGARDFSALFGIDDAAAVDADGNFLPNEGEVDFRVVAWDSPQHSTVACEGTLRRSENKGFLLEALGIEGVEYLVLEFLSGANTWSDHVDVCNAYFHFSGQRPELVRSADMWAGTETTIDIPEAPDGMEHIPLSSLDISKGECGWGTAHADRSVENNPLKLKGVTYTSGVGTHAPSRMIVRLNGSVTDFHAVLGIDDEVADACSAANHNGRASYHVYLSNGEGHQYTVAKGEMAAIDESPVEIHADVNGWKYLYLETGNGSDGVNAYDHVDWASAYFVYQEQNSSRPIMVTEEEISTSLACATTVFSQPGVRFMQKIRAANPDATVAVEQLPAGLSWNASRQLVEGIVEAEGTYTYRVNVATADETRQQDITLHVSNDLPLPVPFMGWISWNSVESEISQDVVERVVRLFQDKGLQDCGWNTVVLDDWWHAGSRCDDGSPRPNPTRFPGGIEAAAQYVHDHGMRFGIYSDAAEKTCAGAFGSYGMETVDAAHYAQWGVDILKYDYCFAPADVESAKERYHAMAEALKHSGRDIRLYICEWGAREPWKWGAEAGGVCWRTTYDVRDTWSAQSPGVGVLQSLRDMKHLSAYQGVNRFNDADMLCTGLHATGKSSNDLCGASGPGMTQDEYRTQFALWCMWSSPLSLSFDPRGTTVTADDYEILTNQELIALDQDRMGQQADLIDETADFIAFAKDCENGDIALSVTNLTSSKRSYTFEFNRIPHLDASQTYRCRDLWRHADLEVVTSGAFSASVASHATAVFRLSRADGEGVCPPSSAKALHIFPLRGAIRVEGAEGESRRILVSDMAGRTVYATTTDRPTEIPMPSGIYVVSAVCHAQASNLVVKVQ